MDMAWRGGRLVGCTAQGQMVDMSLKAEGLIQKAVMHDKVATVSGVVNVVGAG